MKEPKLFVDEYGTKSWWVDGKRHRFDGPAIDWSDGYKAWYINNI
jgi:hypothetical protein